MTDFFWNLEWLSKLSWSVHTKLFFTRPWGEYQIQAVLCVYLYVCLCFQWFLSDNRTSIKLKLGGEVEYFHLISVHKWGQDGRVVSTPAIGLESPRFDPRQQPFVQLSLWWFKQSHNNFWSLFSLFSVPSFGRDVKPRPRVNRITGVCVSVCLCVTVIPVR